jgi:hypothetical protein
MRQLRERLEQWEAELQQELDRQEERLREQIEERLCQHIHELIARILPDARAEEPAETES